LDAVANLHHIDKQRLSNAQFKKVEELNEQLSELSDLASQYLNTAQRTYDRTEQRQLEDLADLAQDEADRLYINSWPLNHNGRDRAAMVARR